MLRFYMGGQLEAEMPAESLVLGGGAPVYHREYREPAYFEAINRFDAASIPVPDDLQAVAKALNVVPNIASKKWIYTQYDSMVGTGNTQTNGPSDAPVVLVKETGKALAVTTDCNSRYVYADPYKGAMIAVSEAARNIVCSGGTPIGVTNCLNFGNPYDPEVYYQFVHSIKGMGEACLRFDTPVTGGNVSFYNQHPEGAVYPTPTIGMVGILDNPEQKMTLSFQKEGDIVYLLGKSTGDIASSEYLHKICGVEYSPAPYFDIEEEVRLQKTVAALVSAKLVVSAHDVSEGGLFICLLESGFAGEKGFIVTQHDLTVRPDAYWFGEGQSRVVVSVDPSQEAEFLKQVAEGAVPVNKIGMVSGKDILVNNSNWGSLISWRESNEQAINPI
jgi:phosphoribosylformylglycinamidine synthase